MLRAEQEFEEITHDKHSTYNLSILLDACGGSNHTRNDDKVAHRSSSHNLNQRLQDNDGQIQDDHTLDSS